MGEARVLEAPETTLNWDDGILAEPRRRKRWVVLLWLIWSALAVPLAYVLVSFMDSAHMFWGVLTPNETLRYAAVYSIPAILGAPPFLHWLAGKLSRSQRGWVLSYSVIAAATGWMLVLSVLSY